MAGKEREQFALRFNLLYHFSSAWSGCYLSQIEGMCLEAEYWEEHGIYSLKTFISLNFTFMIANTYHGVWCEINEKI